MYQVTRGQVFGVWLVLDPIPSAISPGPPKALCECPCGRKKEITMRALLTNTFPACECGERG